MKNNKKPQLPPPPNLPSSIHALTLQLLAGSTIHPLYERYGDTIDASARMVSDPSWYSEQAHQTMELVNDVSRWDWTSTAAKAQSYFVWPGPLVDHTPKPPPANAEQTSL